MRCYILTKLECAYVAMWLQNTLTYLVSLKPHYESCSYHLQYLCRQRAHKQCNLELCRGIIAIIAYITTPHSIHYFV